MTTQTIPETKQFQSAVGACKDAIESTLTSICGEKPVALADGDACPACNGVIGIISFLGEVNWTFSLVLPEATAVALGEKFAGFAIPFDSPDMGDVVGELANVIAGDIVANLDRAKLKAQMSLPLVARGHEIELLSQPDTEIRRRDFNSPQGRFWFKLAVARKGHFVGRRPGT